jgi:hypothetical protein
MFVYYHGTKADFINKNLDTYYKEKKSIVFITGGPKSTGGCIFTRGNFFANFKELINTLNYIKGIAVKAVNPETGELGWSLLDSAAGGGYLAFNNTNEIEVRGVDSGGIEISFSKNFVNQIEDIVKDLEDLKPKVGSLENKLDPNIDGSVEKRVLSLENQIDELVKGASEGFKTLAKTEEKIKALLRKIKPKNDKEPISIGFEEDKNDIISVNLSINVDDTSIHVVDKKLSVKSVDGGIYSIEEN